MARKCGARRQSNNANPLKLHRALDVGVRIVLAHCASDGEDIDYGNGNVAVKSFDLFLRLMNEPTYEVLIFGEISAITLLNHAWTIKPLLQCTEIHCRLLNGLDCPLPGTLLLISLEQLVNKKFTRWKSSRILKEIRLYNLFLFDFALKQLLQFKGKSFANSVFETRVFSS